MSADADADGVGESNKVVQRGRNRRPDNQRHTRYASCRWLRREFQARNLAGSFGRRWNICTPRVAVDAAEKQSGMHGMCLVCRFCAAVIFAVFRSVLCSVTGRAYGP